MKRRPLAFAALTAALCLVAVSAAGSRDSTGPTFARATSYATGHQLAAVAVGNLTGDGRPDLVSANGSPSKSVSVLINKGGGHFLPKRDFGTGGISLSVAIGDLNGDGSGDIATANRAGTVSILLNNGDGTFRGRRDYATGRYPSAVAIGDVNGDGKLDLVTASEAGISVLLNAGDGTLEAKRDFGHGFFSQSLAVGDVNGDRSPDLAVGGEDAMGYPKVAVFLDAGDGSFPTRHDYDAFIHPASIEIGDVNGDQKPDLVWSSSDKETGPVVVVQLNRGHGGFGQSRVFSVHGNWSTGGSSVAVGDFTGDRKADLAVTSRLEAVSILVNKGANVFQPQLDYGVRGDFVLAADLNGDRRQDLVAGEAYSGVSVLLNRPGLCNVQYVRRLTLKAARQTLARANCRVGKVGFAYSSTIRGLVIRQRPKLGAVLPGGSRVDVVVSRGGRR